MMFVFICETDSSKKEDKFTDLILEIITKAEVQERFDNSDKFWGRFGGKEETLKKKPGLYKIDLINNPCQIVVAVNPKEFFEQFKNLKFNKKYKTRQVQILKTMLIVYFLLLKI